MNSVTLNYDKREEKRKQTEKARNYITGEWLSKTGELRIAMEVASLVIDGHYKESEINGTYETLITLFGSKGIEEPNISKYVSRNMDILKCSKERLMNNLSVLAISHVDCEALFIKPSVLLCGTKRIYDAVKNCENEKPSLDDIMETYNNRTSVSEKDLTSLSPMRLKLLSEYYMNSINQAYDNYKKNIQEKTLSK